MLMRDDGTFQGVNDDIRKASDPNITRAQVEDASSPTNDEREIEDASAQGESKRSRSPSEVVKDDGEPAAKRSKLSDDDNAETCKAPPLENTTLRDSSISRKNVYLAEGWRDRWCRCVKVSSASILQPVIQH